MDLERILDIAIETAAALDAVHSEGIVHRDINGLAKLTVAPAPTVMTGGGDTLTEEHLTSPGTSLGTVSYMSPEQVLGRELDARTDLSSFGIVCYEMASGRLPFRRNFRRNFDAVLHEAPVALARLKSPRSR